MNQPLPLPYVTINDFSDPLTNGCYEDALVSSRYDDSCTKTHGFSSWDDWSDSGQQVDSGVDDENEEEEKVKLPSRYHRLTRRDPQLEQNNIFVNNNNNNNNINNNDINNYGDNNLFIAETEGDKDEAYNTLESREKDISTALKWIRQEMMYIKKQNKSLLKQFTDLRASMLQLRYTGHSTHGSLSDLSSVDGSSTNSLNEAGQARPTQQNLLSVTSKDPFLLGAGMGKQSVSLPCSPLVGRSRKLMLGGALASSSAARGSDWERDGEDGEEEEVEHSS